MLQFYGFSLKASVTRFGCFLMVLMTNIASKEAQIFSDLSGFLEELHVLVKTALATFCNLGESWAAFYFNIWSRCSKHSPLSNEESK